MASASPLSTASQLPTAAPAVVPALEALARAPLGEEDMTPEQQATFARIVSEFEAGRARLVDNDDVPAMLQEMARSRAR